MKAELFFVAFYKHGWPQNPLFAGPFLDEEGARTYVAEHKRSESRCVVSCELEFSEVEDMSKYHDQR